MIEYILEIINNYTYLQKRIGGKIVQILLSDFFDKSKSMLGFIFLYAIYPVIALSMFFDTTVSVIGVVFSYLTMFIIFNIMKLGLSFNNVLTKIKNFAISLIPENIEYELFYKIELIVTIITYSVLGAVAFVLIKFFSVLFGIGSMISSLNPLMILLLNIYYIAISIIFVKYGK